VIDNLHRDPPRLGLIEGPRGIAIERGPNLCIDLSLEARLKRAIGIIRTEEVGVADEKAFFVVVGVDEPAGDAFGAV
jgi:hypothetical protein